jgi:hypothetical protein
MPVLADCVVQAGACKSRRTGQIMPHDALKIALTAWNPTRVANRRVLFYGFRHFCGAGLHAACLQPMLLNICFVIRL